ncbi:dephospho-CoA kinase [Alphaproteobacteria bacterium]|nr:dephospho-CoA kinase [Alphaproteobacteria bacterium]
MTKIVGITGGIGSGKTTFSNHLKKMGYLIHESDVVVSEIYSKPKKKFLSFIKEKISQDAVKHNKINKTEIANVIFSNKAIKKLLERFIHKEVQSSREGFIKKNTKKKKKIIFADIPLLFENKLENNFDLVICIISSKKNRIKRVLKNKKFTKDNLDKIFKAQTTDKERKKRSQIIIYNNKAKKDFIFYVEKVLTRLIK